MSDMASPRLVTKILAQPTRQTLKHTSALPVRHPLSAFLGLRRDQLHKLSLPVPDSHQLV